MTSYQIWFTLVAAAAFVIYLLVAHWYDKLPSTQGVNDVFTMLNSRGGNILVLTILSVYFFRQAMILFYMMLAQIQSGSLTQDNAIALMAVQFVTSSAFGGAMGALLKTMTGEGSRARTADGGTTTVESTTTSTTTIPPKTPPTDPVVPAPMIDAARTTDTAPVVTPPPAGV